ncbi:MAG: DUF2156 domain-containing protein [Bifidobacterium choerinum]
MSGQTTARRPHDDGGAGVQLGRDLRRWAHEQRFALWTTFGFVVVNLCWWLWYAAQHRTLPYASMHTTLGAFDLARLLPSLVLTRSVFQLIVEALLIVCMLCIAEPMMGVWRTVTASLSSAVIGIAFGLLLCAGFNALLQDNAIIYHVPFTLSPLVLVVGALFASTAFAYQLWRRRILLIGYTTILVVLLYGGNPGDYCLLVAAIAGQLIGRAMAGPPIEDEAWHWQYSSSSETRRILGAIGVVLAVGPVIAATSRSHAGPLTGLAWVLSPVSVNTGKLASCMHGQITSGCFHQYELMRASMTGDLLRSVLPLLVMVALAIGVYLGRRAAAVCSIVFYLASSAITVCYYLVMPFASGAAMPFSGRAVETCVVNTLVPLLYAVALIAKLPDFSIRTKARPLHVGLIVLGATLVLCAAVYLVFGLTHAADFAPRPGLRVLLAELPGRFLPIGFLTNTRLAFVPGTALASAVYQGVGIVFWIVFVVVAFAWLNATIDYDRKAHARAEELVEHGGESMSFMTTWEGNEYWISPTGRSAVAYRVLNHIALTTTGPFGDSEEWMSDLDEFARFCRDHSWSPVFYAVHRPARDHLARLGWHSIMVGDEMVIDPRAWKTTGKKWQDVRTAINKAKREGITDVMGTYADAPSDVQTQIQEISEQWSQGKALPEMKFTLGGVEELKDPRVRILYAIDADGVVQAVTSWLPTWRDGHVAGWTLDFMRYHSGSYNGIMEFLIARMAQRMHDWDEEHPDEPVDFISLSAAPLTGLHDASEAKPDDGANIDGTVMLQHSLALVADLLEPAYGFKSLYNFKKKFQPSEHPVYICYLDSALLANLGIAIVRAYLPTLTFRGALGMLSSFKPKKADDDTDKKKDADAKKDPDSAQHDPGAQVAHQDPPKQA